MLNLKKKFELNFGTGERTMVSYDEILLRLLRSVYTRILGFFFLTVF